MPRIPVQLGQENRVKVVTAFGAPSTPLLSLNATNVAGGIVTSTRLIVDGKSDFLGISTFQDDIYAYRNITVLGITTFRGAVNFNSDIVLTSSTFNSDILPFETDTYNIGISTQRWSYVYANNIDVNGSSKFQAGVGKTYGLAYFGPDSEILSTSTPSVGIQTTNLLLTVDENNVPVWTDSIDGGFY